MFIEMTNPIYYQYAIVKYYIWNGETDVLVEPGYILVFSRLVLKDIKR